MSAEATLDRGRSPVTLAVRWWLAGLAVRERTDDATDQVPAWAATIEAALAAPSPAHPPPQSWLASFAEPFWPLAGVAADRLAAACERRLGAGLADTEAVTTAFATGLAIRHARTATRTLVFELNRARTGGELTGADPYGRFDDFNQRLTAPAGLAALFTGYPVLARLLAQASTDAADAAVECVARFAADRRAIVRDLLGGTDPGALTLIEPRLGDAHRHGRSVSVLRFADGRQVVYKPRSLAVAVQFGRLVGWLNDALTLDVRIPATMSRAGYGWQEWVSADALAEPAGAGRYYHRLGALLALFHATRAVDMHCENVIAYGEHPVVVDVETLFHRTAAVRGPAGDPAAAALAESVWRTGVLPYLVVDEHGAVDRSAFSGGQQCATGGAALDVDAAGTDEMRLVRRPAPARPTPNVPVYDGRRVDPLDHAEALLDGFRQAYDAAVRGRAELAALLRAFADLDVRLIVRPTPHYGTVLAEATHPDLLRDGADRDRALAVVWDGDGDRPQLRQFREFERTDLWNGDIPLFTTRPGRRDVWASTGAHLPARFERSGVDLALATLAGLGDADRLDQESLIHACLATRRTVAPASATGPGRLIAAGPGRLLAAEPSRLLAAACGLADQIVARGLADEFRVNWLGLQPVEVGHWVVLPLGAGLAHGYVGVALFLAQLADLTAVDRYADVARRALAPLPRLWDSLTGRPDLVAAIGCGGYEGLGGIGYALARTANLLADAEIRVLALAAVDLAADALEAEAAPGTIPTGAGPAPLGWAEGAAGCLAAMLAVDAELDHPRARSLAAECAARVVDGLDGTSLGPGFAHGAAGAGHALARLAATGGAADERAAAAAAALDVTVAAASDMGDPSWCSGLAGVVAAGASSAPTAAAAGANAAAAARALARRPLRDDLSLCHGELGIAEALTINAMAGGDAGANHDLRYRAGLVLDALARSAQCCGTPGGVSTPGLLTGLSGIGYGLLRLGFAHRVPSVLLLEPTPTGGVPCPSTSTALTSPNPPRHH